MLCSYGAEVIKIENLSGDDMRSAGNSEGVVCEDDKNPLFSLANSGKKLIAVNLKSPEGKELFERLLAWADVFITNVRAASLERLGIGYDAVAGRFPRLIYAALRRIRAGGAGRRPAGLRQHGLLAAQRAYRGLDGRAAPLHAHLRLRRHGHQLRLRQRHTHGPAGPRAHRPGDLRHHQPLRQRHLVQRRGRHSRAVRAARGAAAGAEYVPADPLSDAYLCSDGRWIGFYDNEYRRDREKFARILDFPQLAEDSRYESLEALRSSGAMAECVETLRRKFASRPSGYWQEYLSAENVACQTARTAADVSRDAQALENGYLSRVEFAGGLEMLLPEPPVAFGAYSSRKSASAGRLGRDTDEVLGRFGYTAEETEALRAGGVVV